MNYQTSNMNPEKRRVQTSREAWQNVNRIITTLFYQLKPAERISLSEWACRNFYISPEYSSDHGLYSYDKRPFQKEPLDEIGNPENEEVVIVSATQMLKTIINMIALAFKIKTKPGPILYVMDTKENAASFSRLRLDPMIRDNEFLTRVVQDVKPKTTDTILMKKFLGGLLKLIGANSPAGLISVTMKDLMLDEVDAYPISAGQMGDPVQLAIKRTTEFEDRQILLTSSPGTEGASRIWPEFEQTDQRYFYVPCPHCDTAQSLKWGGRDKDFGIKWVKDEPETAYYLCEACHKKIYNRDKYLMNSQGYWKKTFPDRKNKPGFHINRLYSPSSTTKWENLVADFLEAQKFASAGDTKKLQVFVNTALAELWKPNYGVPKVETFLQRVEDYYYGEKPLLPEWACFLTAFIDVQDDRLELGVECWGVDEENGIVTMKVFPGNPGQEYVWNEVDAYLLGERFEHPSGLSLAISAAGVDTGGHYTDEAYEYVKDKAYRRIYGTKGYNEPGKPIVPRKPFFGNKANIPLYYIGTDTAKDTIFARLKIVNEEKRGAGYIHFNHYCDADYFEQLVNSERRIMKSYNGLLVPYWIAVAGKRNEALDIKVGNLAILKIANPNLNKIYEDLMKKADKSKQGSLFEEPKKADKPAGGPDWVNKWRG